MTRLYAKISISIWRSKKFKYLEGDDRARLLYLHLHSCPSVNSVGCFNLPLGYITADLGWDQKSAAKAIDSLSAVGLIEYNTNEDVVRIVDFIRHDPPTNPKHAQSMFRVAKMVADCSEKLHAFKDLHSTEFGKKVEGLRQEIDRLSIGYIEKNREAPPCPLSLVPCPLSQTHTQEDIRPSDVATIVADPISEAVAIYNSAAKETGWPQCQILSKERRGGIRARLKDCGGIEGWRAAIEKATASDFLSGRTARTDGHENWTMDLNFLIKAANFTKLMEGKYDNRGHIKVGTGNDNLLAGAAQLAAELRARR